MSSRCRKILVVAVGLGRVVDVRLWRTRGNTSLLRSRARVGHRPTSTAQRTLQLCAAFVTVATAFAQDDCCVPKPEGAAQSGPPLKRVLRITADPNNLPFSNERREGFENKIADLIARELDANIEYSW